MACRKKKRITQLQRFGSAVVRQTSLKLRGERLLLRELGAQDRYTKSQYGKPLTHQGDEKYGTRIKTSELRHLSRRTQQREHILCARELPLARRATRTLTIPSALSPKRRSFSFKETATGVFLRDSLCGKTGINQSKQVNVQYRVPGEEGRCFRFRKTKGRCSDTTYGEEGQPPFI